jgi:hypothetical protein
MLHLIKCRHAAPYWKACFAFCETVLGTPRVADRTRAIILGLASGTTLLGETPRAFLRHAFGAFYADATKTHKEGTIFHWQFTFRRALLNFRDAVLRYGKRIALHHTRRYFTNLVCVVPAVDRDRYNILIEIEENGESHLTSAFKSAIDSADAAATAEQNRPANQRRR